MAQNIQTFAVGGGLDLSSPALAIPAGRLRSAMNYEPVAEGYSSIDGYERFDGRPLPSDADFWVLSFDHGTNAPVTGQTLTGQSSGATARLLQDPITETGTWGAGNASGKLIVGELVGQFVDNENIKVGAAQKAIADGIAEISAAANQIEFDERKLAAVEYRRSLIQKVPGEGPTRAVKLLQGVLFAIRDNVGASAAAIWRATGTGWSAVPLSRRINFTAGLLEINEGDILTGASSGASAVVKRVIKKSGNWGSDAAGYIIINGMTGGALVAENLKLAGSTAVTASAPIDLHLPPGGRYSIIEHNFFGSASRYRLYGVSGVWNAFEFDGEVLCPIETGTPVDTPTHIGEHGNHIVLGFSGGSVQVSSDVDHLLFDGEQGSAEFGLGADITDFLPATQSAFVIFGQSKIAVLTGTDVDTYQFDVITEEAGAEPWTAQKVGQAMYLDAGGLRTLEATASYGNFKTGSLTQLIDKLLQAKVKSGAKPVLSYRSRTKTHYRLLWDDGTGISVFMGRKYPEIMPFETGDARFCCVESGLYNGSEAIFAGGEDGYVYALDSGCSMDGDVINGFMMFPFNHLGSPMQNKRYHGVAVELDAAPRTTLSLVMQFDYANDEQPHDGNLNFFVSGGQGNDFVVSGGGGVWDVSTWDDFFWSAPFEGEAYAPIDGFGKNASLLCATRRGLVEPPHTIKTYSIYSSPRGTVRRLM